MFIPSCPSHKGLLSNCFDWVHLTTQTHLPLLAAPTLSFFSTVDSGTLKSGPPGYKYLCPGLKAFNCFSTSLKSFHYPYYFWKIGGTKCFLCQDKCIFSSVEKKRERDDQTQKKSVIKSVSYRVIMVLLFPLGSYLFCSWSSFSQKIQSKMCLK